MIVLIMGVSGSGKTTIGQLLSKRLGWGFSDADEFHSDENKARMAQGIPLTDADRRPWLQAIHAAMLAKARAGENHIFACSALKKSYRELLHRDLAALQMVFLAGTEALLSERLRHRRGHFFAPELLADQLAVLEPPGDDEALVVAISLSPEAIVDHITQALDLRAHRH